VQAEADEEACQRNPNAFVPMAQHDASALQQNSDSYSAMNALLKQLHWERLHRQHQAPAAAAGVPPGS
jgi:hypothetical protein